MKKITIILCLLISTRAHSQTLSTDSLSIIIRTLQKQVAALQAISWQHVITFTPSQFLVTNTPDSLHQTISINPTAITVQSAAPVDLTPLTTRVANLETLTKSTNTTLTGLQTKVSALKATSITTTTIQ